MKKWVVDLSDYSLSAYINRGAGLSENGVSHSESGIEFDAKFDPGIFPMYAVNFSDYLDEQGLHIEDVLSFELVAIAYDEVGDEIDLSMEYEKVAFVSEDALDGYSNSDILPSDNYKPLGSGIKTKFDLTKYTGFKSDGTTLSDRDLEDGAGFNIQIMNGEINRISHLSITSLVFYMDED